MLDPRISQVRGSIEMFVTPEASGGVMEPSGIVEVKVRPRDLTALGSRGVAPEQCRAVMEAFAALHDTPARMLAVGAVRAIVPWAEGRRFFYWRARYKSLVFRVAEALGAGTARGRSYVEAHLLPSPLVPFCFWRARMARRHLENNNIAV